MLRILHLEDDPIDAQLALRLLREGGLDVAVDRVRTLAEFKQSLRRKAYCLILSDYTVPGVDTLGTLQLARQMRPEVPFVFLAGTLGEDVAIETLKMGATDYVLKQNIARLVPAIRRALQEAQEQVRRKQAEAELRKSHETLEERVQQRTRELKEANANLQSFAYTAAHDLRSPLRAISSFAALLLEDYGATLDKSGRSMLEQIARSAEQTSRLIYELLKFSELSQAELQLEPVNLRTAVRDALVLLDPEIRGKRAAITVTDPLPEVIGHRATTVLLINNLASNALKFVPAGAQPRLHIWAEASNHQSATDSALSASEHEPAPNCDLKPDAGEPEHAADAQDAESAGRPGPTVRLCFQDNGIGIAPEDLRKLFVVFQRLHSTQGYVGTGLGLALVKKGAERMGGRVGADSEPGHGSVFWVEFKRAVKAQPAEPGRKASAVQAGLA